MSVKIGVRQTNDVTIVDISGRLTLGEGATELHDMLSDMAKAGQKKILLNLAEVSYLDSAGLGVLVSSFATLNNKGGRVKLLSLSTRMKDLLMLTKLYTVFEIYEDEALAVHSFPDLVAAR